VSAREKLVRCECGWSSPESKATFHGGTTATNFYYCPNCLDMTAEAPRVCLTRTERDGILRRLQAMEITGEQATDECDRLLAAHEARLHADGLLVYADEKPGDQESGSVAEAR
jgi:hypothetical protein